MRAINLKSRLLASSVFVLLSSGYALAQVADDVDTVVVTGSRGQPRTVLDSPVPVDVLSADEIQRTSQTDTDDILKNLVPSFNVNRDANSTTGSFIRPISMRGLPEDETLMLVNSKRRHVSASIGLTGSGAQGPDAAVIPAIALKSVEVERDGAAALYGSDAIAGVVNFILKDNDSGFQATSQIGQTSEGDGQSFDIAANLGLPLLVPGGFVNLSAEFNHTDQTTRAGPYTSPTFNAITWAQTHPAYAANVDYLGPLQQQGQPSLIAFRSVVNSAVPVTDNSQIYFFGNYSLSRGTEAGNYRYPGNGQPVEDVPVRQPDGTVFAFENIYPYGFRPNYTGQIRDWSSVVGYRGDLQLGGNDLTYDFSGRYGWDQIAYSIDQTVNPSMGPDSPSSFKPYTDTNNETSLDADFTYTVPFAWMASPLVIAAGAEYRRVYYSAISTDPNSYAVGPYASKDPYHFCNGSVPTAAGMAVLSSGLNCANPNDPVYHVLQVGSTGVTGLAPAAWVHASDANSSLYSELSGDILQGWTIDMAGRYENYDSFGSDLTGKFATKYQINDWLGVRGSIGSGFHAPSPGMISNTNISIQTVNGVYTQAGLFPASNPVAKFLGAKPLVPETSLNVSAGITLQPFENFTATIDSYAIRLYNQIYSTSQITVTPAIVAAMTTAGIQGASQISSVNFFQNAFDSTTSGIDFVSTYHYGWDDDNTTYLTGSFNINRYQINDLKIPNLFTAASAYNFEHGQMVWRGVLTATHDYGPWSALLRMNLYGPYSAETTATPFLFQKMHPDVQFDAELGYDVSSSWRASLGILNLFNKYPETNNINATGGVLYRDSPESWQGSTYYARLQYTL